MKKIYWQDIFYLSLLLAIIFGVFLGLSPLTNPDEGRYAEVAREFLARSNFITPTVDYLIFLDKPPLVYWLMAFSMKIFGVGVWAVRLIPALFAYVGCIGTFITAAQLYNRRTAWLAAIILASSLLYFAMSHYVNMDMAIAVLISLSLYAFILAVQQEQYRTLCFYLFYLLCALGFLCKGLIAFVFPCIVIGSWMVLTKNWRLLKKMHLFRGTLLILAISLPWCIAVQKANPEFFHYFFIFEQFTRYSGNQFNNQEPFWFYLTIVLFGFLPWTAFIFDTLKKTWITPKDTNLYFLLWIGLIFVFFSISHSKILSYILPIFPALALLTAVYVDNKWETYNRYERSILLYVAINISLAIGLVIFNHYSTGILNFPLPKILLYLIVALLLASSSVFISKKFSSRFILIGCITLLLNILLLYAIPKTKDNSAKILTSVLQPLLKEDDHVVFFENYYQDIPFYLQRRIIVVYNWQLPNLSFKDTELGQLAWGYQYQPNASWMMSEQHFWTLWHSKQRVFVFMESPLLEMFEKIANSPVYIIRNTKQLTLLSNQQLQ